MNATKKQVQKAKEVIHSGMKFPEDNLLRYDDPCCRKQMASALAALSDEGRWRFLNWCCRQQKQDHKLRVAPNYQPSIGYGGRESVLFYPVVEAVNDLAMLTLQYRLPAKKLLEELERRAKKVR